MPHRAQRSQSAQTKSADCCGDASVLASLLRKSRMPVVALIFCSLRSISIRTNCTADAGVALTKINTPCDHGLSRRMFGRGSTKRTSRGAHLMSAFGGKAGHRCCCHKRTKCVAAKLPLFDHLSQVEPQRLSGSTNRASRSATQMMPLKLPLCTHAVHWTRTPFRQLGV